MLKKQITFEDLETGQSRTEEWYFNLSKAELVQMEVTADGGYEAAMQRIVEAKDGKAIMAEFERFILGSVGEKTEQGGFRKNQEIRDRFKESPAYSELFMELVTSSEAGANFLAAIVPQQLGNRVAELSNQRRKDEAFAKMEEETGISYGRDARQISQDWQEKQAVEITPNEEAPRRESFVPAEPEPTVVEPSQDISHRPYTTASDKEPERNVFDQQQYQAPVVNPEESVENLSNMSIEEFRRRQGYEG